MLKIGYVMNLSFCGSTRQKRYAHYERLIMVCFACVNFVICYSLLLRRERERFWFVKVKFVTSIIMILINICKCV